MSLTPEQKKAVAGWVAAGDNLSVVQKKLSDEFKISLTYRDVRFLVDDLDLALKDPAPKVDASDVSKTPPPAAKPAAEKKGASAKGQELPGAGEDGALDEIPADEGAEGELPPDELVDDGAPSNVTVDVDKVTLTPGALASGSVTFSDGVTAKWIVDQYGRPGFTEVSQPGYRPTPADGQAFMQELSRSLQQRGF
ncbi:MAG: hypothetical protein V4773_25525 [Verrucomicrobiota bacterium]